MTKIDCWSKYYPNSSCFSSAFQLSSDPVLQPSASKTPKSSGLSTFWKEILLVSWPEACRCKKYILTRCYGVSWRWHRHGQSFVLSRPSKFWCRTPRTSCSSFSIESAEATLPLAVSSHSLEVFSSGSLGQCLGCSFLTLFFLSTQNRPTKQYKRTKVCCLKCTLIN